MKISISSFQNFIDYIKVTDEEPRHRYVIEKIQRLIKVPLPDIVYRDNQFTLNGLRFCTTVSLIEIYGTSTLSPDEVNIYLEQLKVENL